MQKKKLYLFIFVLIICLIAGCFFGVFPKKQGFPNQDSARKTSLDETINQSTQEPAPEKVQTQVETSKQPAESQLAINSKIQQEVLFVVQAPFANWKDLNFQNGCEEASMIMAMGWIHGEKSISPAQAKKRILEIIDFENKTFGYSADTDVFDMQKIFKQYFKNENIKASENITLEDIKDEIQNGKVVLVPAFGRALKNPNFTAPGPIAHMLVIIGYDPTTKEFITNDPGTRKGAGYRYGEKILFDAIWSYPSGKDIPPLPETAKMKKAMISISKID